MVGYVKSGVQLSLAMHGWVGLGWGVASWARVGLLLGSGGVRPQDDLDGVFLFVKARFIAGHLDGYTLISDSGNTILLCRASRVPRG